MKLEKYASVLDLIDRSIYHSKLNNGEIASNVHLKVPTADGTVSFVRLERRVVAQEYASNEESASISILARTLEYFLEHESTFSEPLYQSSEEGEIHIGNRTVFIDRARLQFPIIQELDNQFYLNCVVE